MASAEPYVTKELTKRTWPDFEWFFSRGNGWDFCWCMYFQRSERPQRDQFPTRAAVSVHNHAEKRRLVEDRRAHGILVYRNGQPVGWCQYGPVEELPMIHVRWRDQVRTGHAALAEQPRWRITCFVTDKRHRKQGVAGVALRAALESIRKRGGGIVEAYPIVAASFDGGPLERPVAGVGTVTAAQGSFGNVSTSGTVSMFRAEGFDPVARIGTSQVVVRRTV